MNKYERLVFEGAYSVSDLEKHSDGRIYISDSQDHNVKVYTAAGELVNTIGRHGEGPGEFQTPFQIDISPDGELLSVTDRARRTSFFSTDGEFEQSIALPRYNSNAMGGATFVSDSLVLLGRQFEIRDTFESKRIHLFTVDGDSLTSFYSYADTPRRFNAYPLSGISLDYDAESEQVYAVQTGEYTISRFSVDGTLEEVLVPDPMPDHYQPITEEVPSGRITADELVPWLNSFDRLMQVFIVNDSLLALEILKLDPDKEHAYGSNQIDLIDRQTGALVHSVNVAEYQQRAVVEVDDGHIYINEYYPAEDGGEVASAVRKYPVEALLEIDAITWD